MQIYELNDAGNFEIKLKPVWSHARDSIQYFSHNPIPWHLSVDTQSRVLELSLVLLQYQKWWWKIAFKWRESDDSFGAIPVVEIESISKVIGNDTRLELWNSIGVDQW